MDYFIMHYLNMLVYAIIQIIIFCHPLGVIKNIQYHVVIHPDPNVHHSFNIPSYIDHADPHIVIPT